MRIALGLMLFLWLGVLSRVLAADPPLPLLPAAPAEQVLPPASPSTPPPAAANAKPAGVTQAKADAVSADGVTKQELKRLQVAGYKQKTRGDQIVYCRVEPVLGTHFDREMCATARDLEIIRANGQEMASQIQRSNVANPKGGP